MIAMEILFRVHDGAVGITGWGWFALILLGLLAGHS